MLFVALTVWAASASAIDREPPFKNTWPEGIERTWVGPEYWANRLQDWRISSGRLECLIGDPKKPFRTVHLLTRQIGTKEASFVLKMRMGFAEGFGQESPDACAGFLMGAGPGLDYRAAALIHHSTGEGAGILAGMDGLGRAVVRDMKKKDGPVLVAGPIPVRPPRETVVEIRCQQRGTLCSLMVLVSDPVKKSILSQVTLESIPSTSLTGNIAIVSDPGKMGSGARFWFRDLEVSGDKIEAFEEDICGPVIAAQYTLSRGVLKLTAQLMPIGAQDDQNVRLDIQLGNEWKTVGTAKVSVPSYTAAFRVEKWDYREDIPYRVVYNLSHQDKMPRPMAWYGEIRKEPVDKETIVVAAFTGNHNVRKGGVDNGSFAWNSSGIWFPHTDLTGKVTLQDPDLYFFSGDQVYEGNSPTAPERSSLDYLYKWYLWCWAYRDLIKNRPCICLPDDHDVYHGNLWGAGGRKAEKQDDGGYVLPPEFVNMVQQTQTSHLPDPYDPAPVEQGIGVYYCAMTYGGISFAVLEDRKFKSSPTTAVPAGKCVNGWFQSPDFDPATQADVPGAVLLGDRQTKFLQDWVKDWKGGAQMKVALSQTLFATVATLPNNEKNDQCVPGLEIPPPGEYPRFYAPVADADSNGWPQTPRNDALRLLRKGFVFHVCGDQHLGSTIHYGVEEFNDAGYALCVPSIANFFPRRWYPPNPGGNHKTEDPPYTGEYLDGFGNRITVLAAANPVAYGREPVELYDRAPGYGVVRLNKATRAITIECWPRWENPTQANAQQYPGWPITIAQEDNYGRNAKAYLPTLDIKGVNNPVIQVIDESNGELVYALRIRGASFRPKVFKAGVYTVILSEPDQEKTKTISGIKSLPPDQPSTQEVLF